MQQNIGDLFKCFTKMLPRKNIAKINFMHKILKGRIFHQLFKKILPIFFCILIERPVQNFYLNINLKEKFSVPPHHTELDLLSNHSTSIVNRLFNFDSGGNCEMSGWNHANPKRGRRCHCLTRAVSNCNCHKKALFKKVLIIQQQKEYVKNNYAQRQK